MAAPKDQKEGEETEVETAPVSSETGVVEDDQEKQEEKKETLETKTSALVTESKSKSSFKTYFWITLLVAFLVALVGGGIFVYYRTLNQKQIFAPSVSAFPSVAPTPTQTPSVTPAAEIKREDLLIRVLNGRGVSGTAAEAKEFLQDLGYTQISTGNADSFTYDQTEISIKESKEDYLSLLLDNLAGKYSLASESGNLDEDEDFDVLIIIGQE